MKYSGAILSVILLCVTAHGQISGSALTAAEKTMAVIHEVAATSYPEIKLHKIRVKKFKSKTSFFKARYSILRYATFQRMRHLVFVNPRAFELEIPEEALRSIIAHELSHVFYYTRKNRFELLGLIRLTDSSASAGFERKADLEAISKGFGEGLILYRQWLYEQISDSERQSKAKTYFTPPEIRLIMRAVHEKPELIAKWRKDVPREIEALKRDTGYE